jgi:hypothetical protein
MNVLRPHLSPNRRARPTMSGNGDAKMMIALMRIDRAADAPELPFAAGRDANLKPIKSSPPPPPAPASSSRCAPSSSSSFDAHDSRSASGSLAAAGMISQPTKRGPPHPVSRATTTTTTTASTFSSKIAESLVGGGGRSLHLLFKRSTSHPNRYLSVADGSEGNHDDDDFAAASSSPRTREEGPGGGGEGAAVTPPVVPAANQHGSKSAPTNRTTPTTMMMVIVDGSDSLTDEGYDGFAAGSWHSQETLRQSTKASSAAPASPQSVIIRDAAELEASAACPSTPYSRRRRRRSSMPLMSGSPSTATRESTVPAFSSTSSHPATSSLAAVACNWTDPARRTLWVTSPGSARAHLEFNPRSFVASDDDDEPDVRCTVFPSLNRTGGEYNGRPGPNFHDLPTSSTASPDTGRRQYQRRHSSAGGVGVGIGVRRHSGGVGSGVVVGGNFPAFRGLIDNARRDAAAEEAASPPASGGVVVEASRSSWRAPIEPAPSEESDLVVGSPSLSGSASSTPSPRRKTRRTATARHITSRRRGPSSSSSIMQHLQVPVV